MRTQVTLVRRMADIDREEWDSLVGAEGSPFLEWDWLDALEQSGCVSARTETVESATAMGKVAIDKVDASGFGMRAGLASMVAWSPNPNNPPFYADFPLRDGQIDESVIARWRANSPLVMVATHLEALQSFDAIGADVGDKDGLLRDDTLIHNEFDGFGVEHEWAVYDGDHVNKIAQRFDEVVLPFFGKHLDMGK